MPSVDVPALSPKTDNAENWIKSTDEKLEFELMGVGEADGITLAPYYKVNHDHYTIYWDLNTKSSP